MLDAFGEILGSALRSGMFLTGLVVGFSFGVAYAVCRRAWKDYFVVRRSVPGLRKAAVRTVPRVIKWGMVAGFVGIIAVAGYSAAADEVPVQPASVPSGIPSSPVPSRSR
jgi:hypothetical protein